MGTDFKKGFDPDNKIAMMPADFLLNKDREIIALKYGEFIGDSWKVEDLLQQV